MAEIFDYDPERGITTFFEHDELTDKTTLHRVQDVEPLVDYTKAIRNDALKDDGIKGNFWHYASIPPIVELELRKKGIDIYNPDHTKQILKEINQNYPYLKMTDKNHA